MGWACNTENYKLSKIHSQKDGMEKELGAAVRIFMWGTRNEA
ncbi:12628_t:CDS:2 [Funneliformis caledonium]|uniref:12628_t:CDS:1 n=1 Tax=Funneliformis caledonium TaxID=1117310 RepID=A0A9N8VWM8_9GLOM|nr:12628_t:CDS:2 [Funneliformis caledonium]